jgi:hypothetical protein
MQLASTLFAIYKSGVSGNDGHVERAAEANDDCIFGAAEELLVTHFVQVWL